MALSVNIVEKFVLGSRLGVIADVTFDASYATGGLALTGTQLKFRNNNITVMNGSMARNATTGAVHVRYDTSTGKLQAFWGDNANAAAAPFIEVTAATNLSAYTVRLFAIGK